MKRTCGEVGELLFEFRRKAVRAVRRRDDRRLRCMPGNADKGSLSATSSGRKGAIELTVSSSRASEKAARDMALVEASETLLKRRVREGGNGAGEKMSVSLSGSLSSDEIQAGVGGGDADAAAAAAMFVEDGMEVDKT